MSVRAGVLSGSVAASEWRHAHGRTREIETHVHALSVSLSANEPTLLLEPIEQPIGQRKKMICQVVRVAGGQKYDLHVDFEGLLQRGDVPVNQGWVAARVSVSCWC